MEAGFSYFTVLFSILAVLVLFMLQKLVVITTRSKVNLPPGPPKLPLIGNLHNLLFSSDSPHRILRDLSMKYGPLMHLKLGQISTIIISSPEAAKQIMKTHDTAFASRPTLLAADVFTYGGNDMVFGRYGDIWRQLRRICTLELLSSKRVRSFRPIREAELSGLCRWIASKSGTTINLRERHRLTNYDIITQVSIGKKAGEQASFVSNATKVIEIVTSFNIPDMYPSVKLFGKIGGLKKKVEMVHKELDRILDNIIDEHKLSRATKIHDDQGKKPKDLMDVLLRLQDDPDMHLTTDNIKAVLTDVFIAGIESSITVVDWAMAEMLKHPRIMKTAQEEVRRVFDSKGYVDESCFDELTYLKLVIKETLRIHPPIPMLIPRESREECEIDGYQIPVKTRVIVNAWAIGRDPKYWDDPDSFRPERFLEKSVDYKGSNFEYIPFGAGKRICPGMTFGFANVELPLAMFLYHFDWVLPNQMKPEDLDMSEQNAMAAPRKNELHVIPVVTRPVPDE